jgi:hypothetical protein
MGGTALILTDDLIPLAIRMHVDRSADHIYEVNPYIVPLAILTASPSSENGITDNTGPKISS